MIINPLNPQKQAGSAHVIIIVILLVAIIAALGFIVWKNYFASKDQPLTETSQTQVSKCESDTAEKDGIFCSEDVGVTFKVPAVFNGKFAKTDNYEIFKGTVDYTTRASAGTSSTVYSAVISGTDQFILTVAKEPLRSGYVDVGHMLQGAYYDQETGLLSTTTSPIRTYNSTTDSYTTSGQYAVADALPSFTVKGVKFYHGSVGDAGARYETYFAVINGSIVKIILKHGAHMGSAENDPSTMNADQIFNELDDAIKNIEIIS